MKRWGMRYLLWNTKDISGLSDLNMALLVTEIDEMGCVLREVGVDQRSKVVHRFPSTEFPFGDYGLFDLQKVGMEGSEMTKADFDKYWNMI